MKYLRSSIVSVALVLFAGSASAQSRPSLEQLQTAKSTCVAMKGFVQQLLGSMAGGGSDVPENDSAAYVVLWRINDKISALGAAIDALTNNYWAPGFDQRQQHACGLAGEIDSGASHGRIVAPLPPVGIATANDFQRLSDDVAITSQNIGCSF